MGYGEIPEEGILLYNSYDKTAEVLLEDYHFELETREDKLFQLSPIINGWSVIGRPDKYLSAGTYKLLNISPNELSLKMVEDGTLLIWCKNNKPVSENFDFKLLSNNLWEGKILKTEETGIYKISGGI